MADEKPKHDVMSDFWFVVLGLLALVILWFATDGPQRADLRGIFLQLPGPLGGGNAYGPQLGEPNPYVPASTTYDPYADYSNYDY